MKKIFNFSILLMLTLAFFVSCGHATGGNGNESGRADTSPLFQESEADKGIPSLALSDLSDGTWEFKSVYFARYDDPYEVRVYMQDWSYVNCDITSIFTFVVSLKFSISGGNVTCISQTETDEYTMDDENKAKLINLAASHNQPLTWNGNTVTVKRTVPAHDGYLNHMFEQSTYSTFTTKKNDAGTCYLIASIGNLEIYSCTQSYYLKKLD